jgi:uncharacterized membrane protein YdjX (TVP38/TMEM64 family)
MKKTVFIVIIALLIAAFWLILSRFFTLEEAQRIATELSAFTESHYPLVLLSLFAAQSAGMIFSLPSKAIITLLSGALLGPVVGSIATLAGVLSGTTVLFFAARCFLRNWTAQKLKANFSALEERLSHHPIRAVMGLRLFITLPYGPVTLAAALSPIRYRDFLIGSLLGDLPVIVVYCIAGQQLLSLTKMSQAVSPWTAAVLIAAGLFFVVTAVFGKTRTRGPSAEQRK